MLVLVVVLTVLAAVDIALTRLRLQGEAAGRTDGGQRLLRFHTPLGVAALVVWTVFLVAPEDSVLGGPLVGVLALALWWVTSILGLLFLARWLPTSGRHASEGRTDGWSKGPWLSLLAHLGLVGGVVVFTAAYLTAAV